MIFPLVLLTITVAARCATPLELSLIHICVDERLAQAHAAVLLQRQGRGELIGGDVAAVEEHVPQSRVRHAGGSFPTSG